MISLIDEYDESRWPLLKFELIHHCDTRSIDTSIEPDRFDHTRKPTTNQPTTHMSLSRNPRRPSSTPSRPAAWRRPNRSSTTCTTGMPFCRSAFSIQFTWACCCAYSCIKSNTFVRTQNQVGGRPRGLERPPAAAARHGGRAALCKLLRQARLILTVGIGLR